jgi:hypothetical protein
LSVAPLVPGGKPIHASHHEGDGGIGGCSAEEQKGATAKQASHGKIVS